jgi:hypothetical protein
MSKPITVTLDVFERIELEYALHLSIKQIEEVMPERTGLLQIHKDLLTKVGYTANEE